MKTVDVHLAFTFDCPDCGHENFVRSVIYEFNPSDPEDMEMAEDLEHPAKTGNWVTAPEEVACSKCGAEMKVNPRGG